MAIQPARAWGFALVATTFAVAVVESGVVFHADAVLPGWDKPVHALSAFGLVLAISPTPGQRRLGLAVAVAAGLAWELVQFYVDPFQGHTPAMYALDTVTDLAADILGAVFALRTTRALTRVLRVSSVDPRAAAQRILERRERPG